MFLVTLLVVLVANVWIPAAQNVALNKPADQVGVYDGMTADRAVDGRLYDVTDGDAYCAHPDGAEYNIQTGWTYSNARWWVDLAATYRVYNVSVYNTGDNGGSQRLQNFAVSIGHSLADLVVCGAEYVDPVGPGEVVTLHCDLLGRYVQVQRTSGDQQHLMTLCEVEVDGTREDDPTIDVTSSDHSEDHTTGDPQDHKTDHPQNQTTPHPANHTSANPGGTTIDGDVKDKDHSDSLLGLGSTIVSAISSSVVILTILIIIPVIVYIVLKHRRKTRRQEQERSAVPSTIPPGLPAYNVSNVNNGTYAPKPITSNQKQYYY